ncbi:MAG: cell envelope integrity protein TolA [Steroidobacteraceae bacterium]
MKKPASEPKADRVVSILLSVLVHAAIVGALLWGWWQYRTPKSVPDTLAIQATVVRNAPQRVHAARPQPAPVPPTPKPTPPPPKAPPDDQAQLQQQARARAAQQAEQKAKQEADREAAEQAAQQQAAAEAAKVAQAQAERKAREKAQREAKLAAERKAKLEAERKAKALAELKAKQDAAREAQLLAQQLKAEQAEQQRQADLQQQMKAEEHQDALEASPEKAEYLSLIQARISRAWIRPASAQPGLKCIVHLTQIPGGEITHVTVEGCNGDDAVRQSVQTAAYRASPLPAPPDPALFDPNITVTFAPDQ